MDECTSFSLSLTPDEVEWVLYYGNETSMRLYPSLYSDKAIHDVQRSLLAAQNTLVNRGCVQTQADGSLALDMAVAGVVGVLGVANAVLQVSLFQEHDHKPQVWRYFNVEDLLVEQTTSSADEVLVTALLDAEVLQTRLCDHLGIKQQSAPANGRFSCSMEDFSDIPYIIAGDGKLTAIAQLVELGADRSFASDIINAMTSPLWQATLQMLVLDPGNSKGIHMLGKLVLIEGIYGLWAVTTNTKSNPPTVEILPCNAEQARSYVSKLINLLIL